MSVTLETRIFLKGLKDGGRIERNQFGPRGGLSGSAARPLGQMKDHEDQAGLQLHHSETTTSVVVSVLPPRTSGGLPISTTLSPIRPSSM